MGWAAASSVNLWQRLFHIRHYPPPRPACRVTQVPDTKSSKSCAFHKDVQDNARCCTRILNSRTASRELS